MTQRELAQGLYYKLSALYSCPYADKREEVLEAITFLEAALKRGVDENMILEKMGALKRESGAFQSKLHAHIISKFWEKEFGPVIEDDRISFEEETL